MAPTPAMLLTLVAGVLIGGGIVGILVLALRARARADDEASREVPDGAAAVLRGMDDAAVVADGSYAVVAASAAAEVFGMVVGSTLIEQPLRTLVRSARSSGLAESETLSLPRGTLPTGPRLVLARATVISARLVLIILRDITERERVEQMRRDFVANTSHELKTPVGAISLLAEAIDSAADDPDQVRHFTARLSAEASRLGQLTSRIMSLSRLQSAQDLSELRDVSVDEVVAAAIESQSLAADAVGIDVVRGGTRGLVVRGDAQILTEAVANLIANAIAYSPPGAQVGVGVKTGEGTAEIAVTDRGIGIPEGEQQRVFERFYRADQARSRRTGGTGLGLSIVKHAVQRHGGDVLLWSRPGRGSTFTVRLPASQPVPAETAKKKKKKKKVDRDGSRSKGEKP
ncbi:sensor histidine kinase [Microbacterium sp.]|uniref:sensor histidine kinase n=1 Tax=Microbacterium sp. TaxID=51671 RepID=UPI003A860F39